MLVVRQEVYGRGVNARKIDALLKALELTLDGKSYVSWICKELDPTAEEFRNCPLRERWPHVWLDILDLNLRQKHRVASLAQVVSNSVDTSGERYQLGFERGASESVSIDLLVHVILC